MNETIRKFGWPATQIADYPHWVVLLRPAAPTLGSLVVAAKDEADAFSALPAAAFAEQARVIADIERVLAAAIGYERINYLMLMMVDRHVHYHIIPRYAEPREFGGQSFADAGWPKVPDLGVAVTLTADQIAAQVAWLREKW